MALLISIPPQPPPSIMKHSERYFEKSNRPESEEFGYKYILKLTCCLGVCIYLSLTHTPYNFNRELFSHLPKWRLPTLQGPHPRLSPYNPTQTQDHHVSSRLEREKKPQKPKKTNKTLKSRIQESWFLCSWLIFPRGPILYLSFSNFCPGDKARRRNSSASINTFFIGERNN